MSKTKLKKSSASVKKIKEYAEKNNSIRISYHEKVCAERMKTLFKAIDKLILDKNFLCHVQKKTLKKFKLTNDRISKNIDNYRKELFKS
jgi:hypothetical protein